MNSCFVCTVYVASFPGHSQILSRSCGVFSTAARQNLGMAWEQATVSFPVWLSVSFPVWDSVSFPVWDSVSFPDQFDRAGAGLGSLYPRTHSWLCSGCGLVAECGEVTLDGMRDVLNGQCTPITVALVEHRCTLLVWLGRGGSSYIPCNTEI